MINFYNRIINISDQLPLYSEEIASTVKDIMYQGFDCEQATKIVGLGIQNIMADKEHERNTLINELIKVIQEISERID